MPRLTACGPLLVGSALLSVACGPAPPPASDLLPPRDLAARDRDGPPDGDPPGGDLRGATDGGALDAGPLDGGCGCDGGCDSAGRCLLCLRDDGCPPGSLCHGGACVSGCTTAHLCGSGFTCCRSSCVDTTLDRSNCGGCGVLCGGGETCCAGACSDLGSDLQHCGSCASICVVPAGLGACNAGVCTVGSCAAGRLDCDGDAADGCEVDSQGDPLHCGGCGQLCASSHGAARCAGGACAIACDPGFTDCNGSFADGCETDLERSISDCGGCGTPCSSQNAAPLCVGGRCEGACEDGYGDCDGDRRGDGCETHLADDPMACGACGAACAPFHVTAATCSAGRCSSPCEPGFDDCNGNKLIDGCETDVDSDAANCGGCGAGCSPDHVTAPACTGGACSSPCAAGFDDCDGDRRGDGCEADLSSDPMNCGACANRCPSGLCVAATCSP